MKCLLCLERKSLVGNNFITITNSEQEVIEFHFWLKCQPENTNHDEYVCLECWEPLSSFHALYIRIQEAHRVFASDSFKIPANIEQLDAFTLNKLLKDHASSRQPADTNEETVDLVSDEELEEEEEEPKESKIVVEEFVANEVPLVTIPKSVLDNYDQPIKNEDEVQLENVLNEIEQDLDVIASKVATERSNELQTVNAAVEDAEEFITEPALECFEIDDDEDYALAQNYDNSHSTSATNETDDTQLDTYIAAYCQLQCPLCGMGMANFRTLMSHIHGGHGKRHGYALCCDVKFKTKRDLADHLPYHDNSEAFRCEICEDNFKTRHLKSLHDAIVHTEDHEKQYQCQVCNKGFHLKGNLTRHIQLHGEKTVPCTVCDKLFVSEYYMNEHRRAAHINRGQVVCKICNKIFPSLSSIRRHYKTHYELRKYKCALCNNRYVSSNRLKIHMKAHSRFAY